jgi:hypothetical protein
MSVAGHMDVLPAPWHLYGLVGSPYVDASTCDEAPCLPTRDIVGREADVRVLRAAIHDAGRASSLQCVVGPSGVGRRTLVRALKAALTADGYLAADVRAVVGPGDGIEVVLGRVLSALHDTVLVNRPQAASHPAMRTAARLVLAARLGTHEETGSEHDLLARFRAERRRRTPALRDVALLDDAPDAIAALAHLVSYDGDRGAVLHLHVKEHATIADRAATEDVLHALHGPMLGAAGLHFVLTGTPDTVGALLGTETHARNVPATHVVPPLPLDAVRELLRRRYQRARLANDRPVVPPVDEEIIASLHGLFRGDLRGLLAALHDGVTPLLGLAGAGEGGTKRTGQASPPSVTWPELRPMLQTRYAARLAALSEKHRVRQLTLWGMSAPAEVHTQKSLRKFWNVSQAGVSHALAHLTHAGYVLASPGRPGQATEYMLSGVSRLIFD